MNISQVILMIVTLISCNIELCVVEGKLKVGFYYQTCPNAESIVHSAVTEATRLNARIPPILIRLHFHDCFVEGCDGSILIENTNGSERDSPGNRGVGGFDQIKKAKRDLEAKCPGVVSCADIVALAARDALSLAGGPFYEVETGRRDGRISNAKLAIHLPGEDDTVASLIAKFRNKGLSEKDLVLLNGGAHTVGRTACVFLYNRLYNFTGKNDSDPAINPTFLPILKAQCPKTGYASRLIPLDVVTEDKFDNQMLKNIKNGISVLACDARLYDGIRTKQLVDSYVHNSSSFTRDFATAMVKMGRIGVKTGSNGEIRRVCHSVN